MRLPVLLLFFACTLGLAWWAYHPGLAGGFLFDDPKNLDAIGAYGRVDSLQTLLLYLSSGSADPTGRPLSLLSFLLDADEWPAEPGPFKRTNVLLQLLNGVLLGWVLLRLGRHLRIAESRAIAAALVGSALWLLHPLWVSTTLYVVQREAMLAGSFCLGGALLWIAGREILPRHPWWGGLCLTGGAWGCTCLAILSKGNGAVLPALLWVIDSTVLTDLLVVPALPWLRLLLIRLPAFGLLAWLGHIFYNQALHPSETAPWNVWQRLLTEPRALIEYLVRLWLPRGETGGLLTDDYPVSTGLLHPWSTLPALLLCGGLLVGAYRLRRKHPAIALAVLFFFAGHLLESTVIPLELYYEHRNYLPAAPMFWPLALWLTGESRLLQGLRTVLALALPLMLALLTHARASLWSNPYMQALAFARASPHSVRAQMTAAYFNLAYGHAELADGEFRAILAEHPDEAVAGLHLVEADCAMGALSAAAAAQVLGSLARNANEAGLVHYWMAGKIALAQSGACPGFDLAFMQRMLGAMEANPRYSRQPYHLRDVLHTRGLLKLADGDADAAFNAFNASLARDPYPGQALQQAALLGNAGHPELGLRHLAYFRSLPVPAPGPFEGMPTIHQYLLRSSGYWDARTAELSERLRADLPSNAAGQPTGDGTPAVHP